MSKNSKTKKFKNLGEDDNFMPSNKKTLKKAQGKKSDKNWNSKNLNLKDYEDWDEDE